MKLTSREIELLDSIDKKDIKRRNRSQKKDRKKFETIWFKTQRLAERTAFLINAYIKRFHDVKFNIEANFYTQEERDLITDSFFQLLNEYTFYYVKKSEVSGHEYRTIDISKAYIGSDEFICDGIKVKIMNNNEIRKIEIFGKIYCSLVDVRSYLIGPKQLSKEQKFLMIKEGILVRTTGRKVKWYIPEDKINKFISIVL